ncbi:MAG: hypothetical protein UR60_C0013G0010 [Candidatus Moranbacteria bacterium GW2011_GWF2_34_56]|nr:MAG: hypothetical protein UR51_C0004G0015 [Candidatus Moranbacteria bacterium GW2011_GWF1_34_10]KKP64874.1 MAG: hypothetical protein UR60_C0013G0010 [Candidatus Moranbacteria bacterium GW2011_GWF2_34_56]
MERTKPLYFGIRIIWYIVGIIESLLGLRFLLKLMQANPSAAFTDFIYSFSGIFVAPFRAVFRNTRVDDSVVEWSALLAMIIYWLLAIAIIKLFVMGKPVSRTEAGEKIDRQDR